MANGIGVIKSVSQGANVVVAEKDGTQRVLNVGDEIYLGETIQTTDFNSKVVIAVNDGQNITLIGKDAINLDKSVIQNESFGDESMADAGDIQKILLEGAHITYFEETTTSGDTSVSTGEDTLIIQDGTIDFNKINSVDIMHGIATINLSYMDSDGNDDTQAVKMLNLKPDDVLCITDNINTILKIEGKNDDSISLKGFTETTDQSGVEAGYTRYQGQTNSGTHTTIFIDVDNDINKLV